MTEHVCVHCKVVIKDPDQLEHVEQGHKVEMIYQIPVTTKLSKQSWQREKNSPWNSGQLKHRTDPNKYKR